MAASVRIEEEAFSDERYEVLARLCGLTDADHARGKMARLWRQCTSRSTYSLPTEIIIAVLGENGPKALVSSDLGDVSGEEIRIRGTRGRIEWLKKLRKASSKGGKAKAALRQADGRVEAGSAVPPPCPPTPTPTLNTEDMSTVRSDQSEPDALGPIRAKVAKLLPAEALVCADLLRELLLRKQPSNAIRRRQWDPDSAARRDWANDFRLVNERDGRTYAEITATIRWLFAQTGDYQFICQSPDAIREKWDRIQAQRNRGQTKTLTVRPKPGANDVDEPPPTTLYDLAEKETA